MTPLDLIGDDETFDVVRCTDHERYRWIKSLGRDEAPDLIIIMFSHDKPHDDCLLDEDNQ